MFQKKINKQAGLTLVELLVSMFIMVTITAVVVYNHKNFTDQLEITNLAYSIALSIREAQISGISVKTSSDETFQSAFGVHFNIGQSSNFLGDDTKFLSFVDLDGNSMYNSGGFYPGFENCGEPDDNEECTKVSEIGRGNFISRICYRGSGVNMTCLPSVKSVDITFLRPKPDAITRFRNSGGEDVPQDDKEAIICLESPQGRKRSIHVLKTGQISVRREACTAQTGGGGGV